MKVKELIEALSKFDKETEVRVLHEDGYEFSASVVSLEEICYNEDCGEWLFPRINVDHYPKKAILLVGES